MEPFVEHALHEDSLAAIDFGDGQKLASCVRINTQKMRYLVRSAQWRIDNDDRRSEEKREQGKDACRPAPKSPPDAQQRARANVRLVHGGAVQHLVAQT